MSKLIEIRFPNTVADYEQGSYKIGNNGVTKIEEIYKAGEMANIRWYAVFKGKDLVAEIKESVCDLFYTKETTDAKDNE